MEFRKPERSDKPLVDRYVLPCGERSNQHTFTTIYCFYDIFGDLIAEEDGWLFVMRSKLETADAIRFMIPFGNYDDEPALRAAVEKLLRYAHERGKKAVFWYITESKKALLERLFPDAFTYTEDRDLAQYIHETEQLVNLSGRVMHNRKVPLNRFYRTYGDRLEVRDITADMVPEIRAFQAAWLADRLATVPDGTDLINEDKCLQRAFDAFETFNFLGLAFYIDGQLRGFGMGCGMSGDTFDTLCEKGDREIEGIYRGLNHQMAKKCLGRFAFINRGEDMGDPGLREAKMQYHPVCLLTVYGAFEK